MINVKSTIQRGAKVLITGGLGFIGSNLAIALVNMGAEVTLIDSLLPQYGGNLWNVEEIRNHVAINISDVRDPFSLQHLIRNQEIIFNLAGQTSHVDSMTDPYTDLDINAKAQLSILEACKNHNPAAKIVFASTRQIYGRPHYLPVDEKHPLQPVDVNGINKMAGEWYHMVYHQVYGIRTSVLRLTNTFGPRMRIKDARQTFLGIWIRRILEGDPIQIFGDGLQIRDYNYVEDVVAALIAAASTEEAFGKILNLGDCRRYTLLDTAKIMIDAFKGGAFQLVDFPPDRKKIDIGDYYADYSLASELLKWSPQTSLRSGIEATLGYFATRLPQYC